MLWLSVMKNITIKQNIDAEGIAGWIAQRLETKLRESRGPVAMTVPGGSTPFPIFEELVKYDLDFSRLLVWPGDDRIVSEDHPASNTGKIRALFEPVGAHVVTLTIMEKVPHFAIAWLGMGGDGHIASLFPNTDPQVNDPAPIRQLTPDPLPPEAPFDRITLTIPALLDSDEVMFVIRGDDKREVFDQAMRGDHDLPIARFLGAANQPVTCFA